MVFFSNNQIIIFYFCSLFSVENRNKALLPASFSICSMWLFSFVLSNTIPYEVRTELDESQGNIKRVVAAVGLLLLILCSPSLCYSDRLHLTVVRKLKLGRWNRSDIQSARSWGDKERERQGELTTERERKRNILWCRNSPQITLWLHL